MKFSHTEEKRDERDLDVLIDEENGLRIIVSRLGAELISLARINDAGKWMGFLHRDDDLSTPSQGWANHSTVMGYYLHRLKNGRSLYRGREIIGCYRRYFSPGNFLSGETRDIEFPGGEMPFSKDELPGSVILELVDVARRKFSYVDPPSGRWVTLDLTGVPYVTLWSDGGPFLCVEPCWGLTDHHEQRAFENKQGIQTIPPRGELRASLSMAPQLASAD